MAIRFAAPIAMAMMLAGCGSIGAIGLRVFNRPEPPPETIGPAVVPPVETAALPPPGTTTQQDPFLPQTGVPPSDRFVQAPSSTVTGTTQQPFEPLPGTQPQQTALASGATVAPSASGIGRTDLLGGWTITASGDSCQLFMTLTSWTGGYRASTRGCADETLKSITAWNLQGDQVVLSGQGGTPVARLQSLGNGRFDGQTVGQGESVSFSR